MIDHLESDNIDINNLDVVLKDIVSNIFKKSELDVTEKIVYILNNIKIDNPIEKVHIIIGIIDNLYHEIVYHNHDLINYDNMKDEVINIIIKVIKTP